jgi:integrase
MSSRGLCRRHQRAWREGGSSWEAYVAGASPYVGLERCAVAGCGRESVCRRQLCAFHDNRLRRSHDVVSISDGELARFVAGERPRTAGHQFSLASLTTVVRHELLYGLQQRDEMPPPLDPRQVLIIVRRLGSAVSLRRADGAAICESGGVQYNSIIRGLFRDLQRHLERAWVAFTGADPTAGDLWEIGLLDLQPNGSRRWAARCGVIDFGRIGQVWLREVAKDWARTERPHLQNIREVVKACRVASNVLTAAGHEDPTALGASQFSLVLQAITEQRRPDGRPYSASHRNLLGYRLHEVIEHGRVSGLMDEVPASFGLGRPKRVVVEVNEDEIGRALPASVIATLDANLGLLGPTCRFGSFPAADLRAMHHVIYQLLRDTGRRPGEIVSLRVGCIEVIEGQHNLIYDNHKAARMRRRLPITTGTAELVLEWEHRRQELAGPPVTEAWLFPTPLLRAQQSIGHVTPACFGRSFKEWVLGIETIDSELLGADGTPVPFDRHLLFPYALRHSYAQRHADAGVPVDVLRELMDHVSVGTTMGYYRVSLKRKQQAIRAVGSLATTATGAPAPFTDPVAWERASVSVPFGNCTEPSNVRAGGGCCPIRFQCSGCGFYRPDPSYLAAIEEHVASLRADRETALAMGAAGYVLSNLEAQIESFAQVAQAMTERLSRLCGEERAEVEEASRLLRRARAARTIPVIAS